MKQRVYVSFFFEGSKFINDLRAIFSDFETLFPTCNEEYFAAKLFCVSVISPRLAKKFDEGSYTC